MSGRQKRPIKDRGEYVKWWLGLAAAVWSVIWGFFLLSRYGVNSPAAIIGVTFVGFGGYTFNQALSLRRYIWYGDLS